MVTSNNAKSSRLKKIGIAGLIALLIGGGVAWYLFTQKFEDTATAKADYTVQAKALIDEFRKNDSAANKKYAEKIITVSGMVSAIEPADTTLNVKMADTTNGSYIIFAFQPQDFASVKKITKGSNVSIKGSCSGGAYSEILETEFISFKRCSLNK